MKLKGSGRRLARMEKAMAGTPSPVSPDAASSASPPVSERFFLGDPPVAPNVAVLPKPGVCPAQVQPAANSDQI